MRNKKNQNKNENGGAMNKSNIILDIDGVLFKENKIKIVRRSAGVVKFIWYLITHKKNPVKIGYSVFQQMHEQWDKDKKPALVYKNHPMPECIAQWMKGLISNKALLQQIEKFIESLKKVQFFASEFETNLVKQAIKVILDEQEISNNIKPIKPMIQLVEHIKRKDKHNLFIISNYAKHAAEFMIEKHKEFFSIFDDIIISANIGMMKPDAQIYQYFLDKHNVDPNNCVFIDDQEHNIRSAEQLGINGIVHVDHLKTAEQLKKLHFL